MKRLLITLSLLAVVAIVPSITQAQVTNADLDPQGNSESICTALTNVNLRYKAKDAQTNGQVSDLQAYLQAEGYLASEPTGYFGLQTFAAVKKFQKDNDFSPTGYVGPLTRARIQAISCDGAASNNSSSNGAATQSTPGITQDTQALVSEVFYNDSGVATVSVYIKGNPINASITGNSNASIKVCPIKGVDVRLGNHSVGATYFNVEGGDNCGQYGVYVTNRNYTGGGKALLLRFALKNTTNKDAKIKIGFVGYNANYQEVSRGTSELNLLPANQITPTPTPTSNTPTINLLSPNGGETYTTGQVINVSFKNSGVIGPVYLYLRDTSGTLINSVGFGDNTNHTYPAGNNTLSFEPAKGSNYDTARLVGNFKLQICDQGTYSSVQNPTCDTSDGYFTISSVVTTGIPFVTSFSPASATRGEQVTVTGTGFTGVGENVVLGIQEFASQYVNSNTIKFTVPTTATVGTQNFYVQNNNGTSQAKSFTVTSAAVASITVGEPLPNVSLQVGQSVRVAWKGFNLPSTNYLKAYLFNQIYGNVALQNIGTVAVNGAADFGFVIPTGTPAARYKVVICDSTSPSPQVCASSAEFNITAVGSTVTPTLTIISPANGAGVPLYGSSFPVTWTTTGIPATASVSIRAISVNNTSISYLLNGSASNTGSAYANANLPAGVYKLQVTASLLDGNAAHNYTGTVEVTLGAAPTPTPTTVSTITITSPNTVETWSQATPNRTIQWTSTNIPSTAGVFIEARPTNSSSYYNLGSNFTNSGSATINIASLPAGSYVIKVTASLFDGVHVYSATTGTVYITAASGTPPPPAPSTASISISQPLSTVSVQVGQTVQVAWQVANLSSTNYLKAYLFNQTFGNVSLQNVGTASVNGTGDLNFPVPSGTPAGKYKIVICDSASPSPQLCASSAEFTITAVAAITAPPTVTSFSPAAAAPGTVVTVTGTNFVSTNQGIYFGEYDLVSQYVNNTTIRFTIPTSASAISRYFVVENNNGNSAPKAFSVIN